MTTTILTFGKFKGKRFCDTPVWYQEWLSKQAFWMKSVNLSASVQPSRSLSNELRGWDGYSRKGQVIYDQIFQQEMDEADKYDPSDRYGHYDGI
jgi:hypothetical protein